MAKVSRLVLAAGPFHQVACAIAADGSAPVKRLIEELDQKEWPDPNLTADQFPDEHQPSMKRRFLALVKHMANYGELEPRHYNRLREGIWEFKVNGLRVSFYDTPGNGTFIPKHGVEWTDWQQKSRPVLPEDFDDYLRVGHYFGKRDDQRTSPPGEIPQCIAVREEDLAYDRD